MKKILATMITGLIVSFLCATHSTASENAQQVELEPGVLLIILQYYSNSQKTDLHRYNMEVSVDENALATVFFPDLCVTDEQGDILNTSLAGGTVILVDYSEEPVGGFPRGIVQEDHSVSITFTVLGEGLHIRVVDPTFSKGDVNGWVCPSDNPADQVRQMHGEHIVTVLAFEDGQQVILTPLQKQEICLSMPHPSDPSQNDESLCDADNQPR